MTAYITRIGATVVNAAHFYYGFLAFVNKIFRGLVLLKPLNPAVFVVLTRQIYFTGISVLGTFIPLSLAVGVALIGGLTQTLITLGASGSIGKVLTYIIVREAAPIIPGVLLALRSSTAVTAEIALMKLNREIDTLVSLSITPHYYLYIPRILAGVITMLALSTTFIYITVIGGYVAMSFFVDTTLDTLISQIYDNLMISDIICFLFKVFAGGFLLFAIPIYTALEIKGSTFEIPIALLRGMTRLFFAGLIIEGLGFLI